jgi:hypothetical protein
MLRFERTNRLQLEGEELTARVALVYQQAWCGPSGGPGAEVVRIFGKNHRYFPAG